MPADLTVHDLRVTLLDTTPPVWRRLRVPSQFSLAGLHQVLQIAFGWADTHLHQWEMTDGTVYTDPRERSWGEPLADESSAILGEVAGPDSSFRYDYDLSEGWEHLVEVLDVIPYRADGPPLVCIDGARSGPPEDCGGPDEFQHLLDALDDPDNPEHGESDFEPDAFDVDRVNEQLAHQIV